MDLDELERLARAAEVDGTADSAWRVRSMGLDCGFEVFDRERSAVAACDHQSDADYVAAANPAAILELIAEVRRLRELVPDAVIVREFWKSADPSVVHSLGAVVRATGASREGVRIETGKMLRAGLIERVDRAEYRRVVKP